MANFEATSEFLHGKKRFLAGKVYAGVPDTLGFYFAAHGWATPTDKEADETVDPAELDAEPAGAPPAEPGTETAVQPDTGAHAGTAG